MEDETIMECKSESTTTETQHTQSAESEKLDVPVEENGAESTLETKHKLSKKKLIAIAVALLIPSKFERVKSECVQIAGRVVGSGNYFMIDTYPDEYENMDSAMVALLAPSAQENALEAIQYANDALGFNGSVYSQMMKTTALMGRQSAETDKYKVSWTYHPDNGLEVTYEKK